MTGNNFLTRLLDDDCLENTKKYYNFFVLFYCPLGNEYQKGGSRCDHV